MRVVHPACIGLGRDNVVWWWHVTPRGLELMVWTTVWGGFFAFCEYLSRVRRLSLTSRGPLNIILTSLLLGVWLTFPPNLKVLCLHGRALLATGLMFPYGLMTTLNVVIFCNTTIKSEYVCCTLVACSIKYVRLLATTFGIAVHCNISIRPESVCYALITCREVFTCCLVTTLDIVDRCDITIRLKFVRFVLVVIRLLPICYARLR